MTEYEIPSAAEAYYTSMNKQRLIVREYILKAIEKGLTAVSIPTEVLGDKKLEGTVIGELLDKGYRIDCDSSGNHRISWEHVKKDSHRRPL